MKIMTGVELSAVFGGAGGGTASPTGQYMPTPEESKAMLNAMATAAGYVCGVVKGFLEG
jgi:hypothetical protein